MRCHLRQRISSHVGFCHMTKKFCLSSCYVVHGSKFFKNSLECFMNNNKNYDADEQQP
jgi:hypothetical protein